MTGIAGAGASSDQAFERAMAVKMVFGSIFGDEVEHRTNGVGRLRRSTAARLGIKTRTPA